MKTSYILSFLLSLFPLFGNAQSDTAKNKYSDPKLPGMAPTRGVVFYYARGGNTDVTSTSKDTTIGNSSAKMERNNRLELSVKIPIILKDNFKLVSGIKYYYEEFTFKNSSGVSEYPLYSNLQRKHLKSLTFNLSMIKSISDKNFWLAYGEFALNGDYTSKQLPTADFMKISAIMLYGWKKNNTKSTALGLYLNYALGRQTLFPIYIYNKNFNRNWGIESILPVHFRLRRNINDQSLANIGYDLAGAAYNISINNPSIPQHPALQLRRSYLDLFIEYERQLYKILWLSVSTGIRQPISFNVTTKQDQQFSLTRFLVRGDPLIKNTLTAAPFGNITVFLTPPKSYSRQALY